MKLQYLGHSCFRITFKNGITILTDPYTKVGYELPKGLTADIVTISHEHFDHNYFPAVEYRYALNKAECYTFNEVAFEGVKSFHDPMQGKLRGENIIFKIIYNGKVICHLGDLGEPISEDLLAKIGKVDVLLLPIGGTYTIDAVQAKEYMEKIAPKLTVPMHYKPQDGGLDITDSTLFLNLVNAYSREDCLLGEAEIDLDTLSGQTKILYMERMK